jgi:hypothetical protein
MRWLHCTWHETKPGSELVAPSSQCSTLGLHAKQHAGSSWQQYVLSRHSSHLCMTGAPPLPDMHRAAVISSDGLPNGAPEEHWPALTPGVHRQLQVCLLQKGDRVRTAISMGCCTSQLTPAFVIGRAIT